MIPSLSVVIPAYNEERRLPATLDAVLRYLGSDRRTRWEVIVVDDGSRDGTTALVERYAAAAPRIRLLKNPGNRGKGYSVRHGMLEAVEEWILFTDADLSTPIEELDKLMRAINQHNADIAIGSRALDRSLIGVRQPAFREYSGKAFNLIMRLLTGLSFADTQCGFKLYSRAAAKAVFSLQQLDGFSFDVEDLVIAKSLALSVVEVPVRWNNAEGTTVNTLQGIKSFADLAKIRAHQITHAYRASASPAAAGNQVER